RALLAESIQFESIKLRPPRTGRSGSPSLSPLRPLTDDGAPRSPPMRRRTLLSAAPLAAATAAGLAACGSGSSGGGSNDSPGSLTYWASNQGTSLENDKEVLTPVLEKFTEESGIEVSLEVIGWADLQTRIQTAITSGQGPDVLNIGNTWGVSLQATGGLLELGDAEFEALGGRDRYVPAALATGGAEGTDPSSIPLYG